MFAEKLSEETEGQEACQPEEGEPSRIHLLTDTFGDMKMEDL
jgi:hypothetical protein